MPKSFGNKSFITPPTAVKLLGDAGDLADLQEATAHMTVMNRMTSGLQQATRRVVLSSGATATLRRAFGQETITLDRSSISSTEDACIPYVESGRQWWGPLDADRGYIQISSDITGSNGPANPAQAISEGLSPAMACKTPNDVSQCNIQVHAKKASRQYMPASKFTGKLCKLIQCVYGSKRTDVSDGQLANVELTATFFRSSVLYTDARGRYWLLQLTGLESATIQAWNSPCYSNSDISEEGREAYHLFSLVPVSPAITLTCTGTEELLETHTPITGGWHATQRGNEGHICLLSIFGDVEGGLYKFVLNDSGAVRQPEQSVADYIASRFSVDFSCVISKYFDGLYGWDRILVPDYDHGGMRRAVSVTPLTAYPDGGIDREEFPVYCRYRLDDTLDTIQYSASVIDFPDDVPPTGTNACLDYSCSQSTSYLYGRREYTSGFTVASIAPKTYPVRAIKAYQQLEREVTGSAGDWVYMPYGLGCGVDDPIGEKFTEMVNRGCAFIDVYGKFAATTDTLTSGQLINDNYGGQALIIPYFTHESFSVFELDVDTTYFGSGGAQYPGAYITGAKLVAENCTDPPYEELVEVEGLISNYFYAPDGETSSWENLDWSFDYSIKGTHFPHVGDPHEVCDLAFSYGATPTRSISCGDEASGSAELPSWWGGPLGPEVYCPNSDSPLCTDTPFYDAFFYLHPYAYPAYEIPAVVVLESYKFGHTNGYFDEDKEYTIHYGYPEFRELCAFTGKS